MVWEYWCPAQIGFRMISTSNLSFYLQIFQRLLSSGQLGLRSYLNLPEREKWRSWVSRQSRRMSSIKWRIDTWRCWLTILSQYSEGWGEPELILIPYSLSTWGRTQSVSRTPNDSLICERVRCEALGTLLSSQQSVLNSTRGTSMQIRTPRQILRLKADKLMIRRKVENHAPKHVD